MEPVADDLRDCRRVDQLPALGDHDRDVSVETPCEIASDAVRRGRLRRAVDTDHDPSRRQVRGLARQEHRARRIVQQACRRRSEHDPLGASLAVRADDDQRRSPTHGSVDEGMAGGAVNDHGLGGRDERLRVPNGVLRGAAGLALVVLLRGHHRHRGRDHWRRETPCREAGDNSAGRPQQRRLSECVARLRRGVHANEHAAEDLVRLDEMGIRVDGGAHGSSFGRANRQAFLLAGSPRRAAVASGCAPIRARESTAPVVRRTAFSAFADEAAAASSDR